MKAVILVGGLGTRLLPLTCNTPKAMMPILNRPFMEHLLLYLKKHGVNEVILAMGYLPDPIQKGLGDGSSLGIKLVYSVEPSALGTAGAVKFAEKYLDNEPFFVFNGDVITEIDLSDMLTKHHAVKPKVSIALTPVENPTIYGVVETDTSGMVKRFVEKPSWDKVTTNMINAGIYILEPEVLQNIPPEKFFMFEHNVFPPLLEAGEKMLSYPSKAYWIDIGTPRKYLQVQYDLLNEATGNKVINQGRSRIHPLAELGGPMIIGPGCTIEKAQIKGPAILGQGCTVSVNSRIETTVLWKDVLIEEEAVLIGCVIGSGSRVGVRCEIGEDCVVGDNVVLGKGSKLAPETKIWPGMKIPPNSQLSGDVGKK